MDIKYIKRRKTDEKHKSKSIKNGRNKIKTNIYY